MTQTLRMPRSDNCLPLIFDEAARLFREKGYAATSMRDIAAAVDMLPGSLHYHFAAKEDLLVAVYEEGVRLITERARAAIARHEYPWQRLEAAAVAHLEALLKTGNYALVVIRVLPPDVPRAAAAWVAFLRDAGMEVVYAPPWQDIPAVFKLALEEDAGSARRGATGSRECRKQVYILRRPCARWSTLARHKDFGSSCDQHITPEGVSGRGKPSSSRPWARHRR